MILKSGFCSFWEMVSYGRAMLVALLFLNRQGLLVPPFRRLKIPLLLGNYAQLMVGYGCAMLVALFFLNRQGLLVPPFRRLKIPLLLGNHAQLMAQKGRYYQLQTGTLPPLE